MSKVTLDENTTLTEYEHDGYPTYSSDHAIRFTILWGQSVGMFIYNIGGNTSGLDAISSVLTSLEGEDLTVDRNNPLNQKYCVFSEDNEYVEHNGVHMCNVDQIRVFHPTKGYEDTLSLEDAAKYIVKAEIIHFDEFAREDSDDESEDDCDESEFEADGDEDIDCGHCDALIESDEDDFHYEVPKGLFPIPFEMGTGVCGDCWENVGYKEHYNRWINERFRVRFIDEKDAADVPELTVGQSYWAINNDGQMVDICTDNFKVGTYCIERFAREASA